MTLPSLISFPSQGNTTRSFPTPLHMYPHLIPSLRKRHQELQRTEYVTDRQIQWHGELPNTPDWSETSRLVAFSIGDFKGGGLYVAFNTGEMRVKADRDETPFKSRTHLKLSLHFYLS